ncbi:MAG: hypothetical protein ACM359_00375 [Bacillota bacterium]
MGRPFNQPFPSRPQAYHSHPRTKADASERSAFERLQGGLEQRPVPETLPVPAPVGDGGKPAHQEPLDPRELSAFERLHRGLEQRPVMTPSGQPTAR